MHCLRNQWCATMMMVAVRSLSAKPERSVRVTRPIFTIISEKRVAFCSAPRRRALLDKDNDRDHPRPSFIVTLERAAGLHRDSYSDVDIWNSGVFDAEVHPHLPPARTLVGVLAYCAQRAKVAVSAATRMRSPGDSHQRHRPPTTGAETTGTAGYLVRSVPVQMCRKEAFRRRLAAAAGVDAEGVSVEHDGARLADALLLMSGSHPLRRLPLVKGFMLDVYDGLQLATSMRESGHLPKDVELWAVANPLTEGSEAGVERIRRKVELGADVIVTQPPLAWDPFERWLRGVHESGALTGFSGETKADEKSEPDGKIVSPSSRRGDRSTGATLLIGMPVITSEAGLRFWLELCAVDKNDAVCADAFASFGASTEHARYSAGWDAHDDSSQINGSGPSTFQNVSSMKGAMRAVGRDLYVKQEEQPYGQKWFEETMLKLKDLGDWGVSGVHVMAPGPGPRQRAKTLIHRGVFGAPRR